GYQPRVRCATLGCGIQPLRGKERNSTDFRIYPEWGLIPQPRVAQRNLGGSAAHLGVTVEASVHPRRGASAPALAYPLSSWRPRKRQVRRKYSEAWLRQERPGTGSAWLIASSSFV